MASKDNANKVLIIEFDNWSWKDYADFRAAIREEDMDKAAVYAAKVVVSWPYEGVPTDPTSFTGLKFGQLAKVMGTIMREALALWTEGN